MKNCPTCGEPSYKVIYMAAPMFLCQDAECSTVYGFWSFVTDLLPVTTHTWEGPMWKFLAYDGSYPRALWSWFKGPQADDEL